ncbi:hypothetical protein RCL_jg10072.t1 [Rhizophagus clarus]|uniref:Uncharacterized protein n=1 Tax=Rhizophagus clarus TaxID=94130 RepID=A0A8H3KRE3_9GLOM|nr:hypothetical protein RCL_jg10072.t1 [Rhizophagus clarus]
MKPHITDPVYQGFFSNYNNIKILFQKKIRNNTKSGLSKIAISCSLEISYMQWWEDGLRAIQQNIMD